MGSWSGQDPSSRGGRDHWSSGRPIRQNWAVVAGPFPTRGQCLPWQSTQSTDADSSFHIPVDPGRILSGWSFVSRSFHRFFNDRPPSRGHRMAPTMWWKISTPDRWNHFQAAEPWSHRRSVDTLQGRWALEAYVRRIANRTWSWPAGRAFSESWVVATPFHWFGGASATTDPIWRHDRSFLLLSLPAQQDQTVRRSSPFLPQFDSASWWCTTSWGYLGVHQCRPQLHDGWYSHSFVGPRPQLGLSPIPRQVDGPYIHHLMLPERASGFPPLCSFLRKHRQCVVFQPHGRRGLLLSQKNFMDTHVSLCRRFWMCWRRTETIQSSFDGFETLFRTLGLRMKPSKAQPPAQEQKLLGVLFGRLAMT